ncbi:hypothetical protein HYH03_018698 [Edaphochlamys debaryana]|uniref:TRP C-terminal domain-containing protein n=1 Tax=Edaphochlamys debaryana TaxID=47281 RepID=A0A835XGJ2_9CHLO|nr:hypothetical protein HYH03_018698 [Edaphochlamys debaryana]|eukprot:KAG2482378.1 hypothetical protein HYH03_018698 [Edaphochlamys debaryana]
MLITHIQYLIIITRINVGWPSIILRSQATLGSITGAGTMLAFSPTCLFPGTDSAQQARISLIAAFAMPLGAALLVIFIWSLSLSRLASHGRRLVLRSDTPHAAMVQMDQRLSLPIQTLVVLLVISFVLYPWLAATSLSMFACLRLDSGEGPDAAYQLASWPRGYFLRNMNQACYQGEHLSFYVPLGAVCVALFCILPPAAVYATMAAYNAKRKRVEAQRLASQPQQRSAFARELDYDKLVLGFLFSRYSDGHSSFEAVMQVEALALVIVDVFGRAMPPYQQALLLLAVMLGIAAVNMGISPLRTRLLGLMEFASLIVLSLTITLGLFFTDTGGGAESVVVSQAATNAIGIIIMVLNIGLILIFVALIAHPTAQRRFPGASLHLRRSMAKLQSALAALVAKRNRPVQGAEALEGEAQAGAAAELLAEGKSESEDKGADLDLEGGVAYSGAASIQPGGRGLAPSGPERAGASSMSAQQPLEGEF